MDAWARVLGGLAGIIWASYGTSIAIGVAVPDHISVLGQAMMWVAKGIAILTAWTGVFLLIRWWRWFSA